MEPLILQTASEDAGKRLDAWLAEQTELTRSAAPTNVKDRYSSKIAAALRTAE